jgi:hypothetical protein
MELDDRFITTPTEDTTSGREEEQRPRWSDIPQPRLQPVTPSRGPADDGIMTDEEFIVTNHD